MDRNQFNEQVSNIKIQLETTVVNVNNRAYFHQYYLAFANKLSLEANIILSKLILLQGLQTDREHNWIYKTIKEMETETLLKRQKQDRAINELLNLRVIEKRRKGIPAKRYFRLNPNIIQQFIALDKHSYSQYINHIDDIKQTV